MKFSNCVREKNSPIQMKTYNTFLCQQTYRVICMILKREKKHYYPTFSEFVKLYIYIYI